MLIPANIIANADDLGLNEDINKAILFCFQRGYINSTSLLTNTIHFEKTIRLIADNPCIHNVGVHVNLAEGRPLTNFTHYHFLNEQGEWDFGSINKKLNFFNKEYHLAFYKEISAQIERAINTKIEITHLDSHCHLHVLPGFYSLFIEAAKRFKLKLRLAQNNYNGNLPAFFYRSFFNQKVKSNHCNYADYFENVHTFLRKKKKVSKENHRVEIMLHPSYDHQGELTDHFDNNALTEWIIYLQSAS